MDLGEIGYTLVTKGKDAAIQAIEEYVHSANAMAARTELAADKVKQATLREIKVYEAKLAAVEKTKRQLETLEASMIRNGAAQLKYQRGIELATESRKLNIITDIQYEKLLDALGEQFRITTSEAEKNSAASRDAADARRNEANDVTRAAAAYQRLSAQLDPAEEKTRRHAQAIQVITEARAKGIITEEEEIRKLGLLGQAEDESIASKAQLAKEYDRVLMRFDPATRAMRNYTDSMVTLNRAEAAGVISKMELGRATEALNEHMRKAGFVVNQWGVELSGNAAKNVRFLRGAVQQAGYQFGDFFIQIQGGISPVVAFGQQFAQLAGIFGATGAVVGAGVAIFTAILNPILAASGAGKKLDEIVGELEKSFSSLNSRIDILMDKNIVSKFGELSGAMQSIAGDMLQLDEVATMKNLRDTMDKLTSDNIEQGWWQKSKRDMFGVYTEPGLSGRQMKEIDEEANFEKLGFDMGYKTWLGYTKAIEEASNNGDMKGVSGIISDMMSEAAQTSESVTRIVNSGGYEILTTYGKIAMMMAEAQKKYKDMAQDAENTYNDYQKFLARTSRDQMGRNPTGSGFIDNGLPLRAMSAPPERPQGIDFGVDLEKQKRKVQELQHQYDVYYNSRSAGEQEIAESWQRYSDYMLGAQAANYVALEADHDAYIKAITNGYQIYADSRIENNAAIAESQRMIDENNQTNELRQIEAQWGRDSLQYAVEEYQIKLQQYTAMVELRDITEQQKDEMISSWQAANSIANLNMSSGIAAAASAAQRLSAWLWNARGAFAAMSIVNDGGLPPMSGPAGAPGQTSMMDIMNLPARAGRPPPPAPTDPDFDIPEAPKGGGSGSKPKEDALEKLRKQIRLEREMLGISEAEQRVLKALGEDRAKYSEEEISQVIAEIEAHEKKIKVIEEQQSIINNASDAMESFFMDSIKGTKTVAQAFRDMAYDIIEQLYQVLVVQRMVGTFDVATGSGTGIMGMLLGSFMANGGVWSKGQQVTAFAQGGVVSSPTYFGMRNGVGLMGEAGPEAIMPLKRGSDGKLGVSVAPAVAGAGAGGNTSVTLNFNITGSDSANVKREIASLIPQIEKRVIQGVVNARKRGGAMAREF